MLCGFTPFWDSGSPMKIYENILKGRVKYPPYVHPDAQDLLGKLITADLTKRLGNLHGGSKDVMQHPWFSEVTWERLGKKDIDAPYIPPIKPGCGDAQLFDKYPEETEAYGYMGKDESVPAPARASHRANMPFPDMVACSPTFSSGVLFCRRRAGLAPPPRVRGPATRRCACAAPSECTCRTTSISASVQAVPRRRC